MAISSVLHPDLENLTCQSGQTARCQWSYRSSISILNAAAECQPAYIPSDTDQLYVSWLQLSVRVIENGFERVVTVFVR